MNMKKNIILFALEKERLNNFISFGLWAIFEKNKTKNSAMYIDVDKL